MFSFEFFLYLRSDYKSRQQHRLTKQWRRDEKSEWNYNFGGITFTREMLLKVFRHLPDIILGLLINDGERGIKSHGNLGNLLGSR